MKGLIFKTGMMLIILDLLLVGFLVWPGKKSPDPASEINIKAPYNQPYRVKGATYRPLAPEKAKQYSQVGFASWYGQETYLLKNGKTTASGEAFHPKTISAAHKTLPLPSLVRVTNLENGKSLLVRVNDRGPFPSRHNASSGKRVIDLSAEAARQLGYYKQGVAMVAVETISLGKESM